MPSSRNRWTGRPEKLVRATQMLVLHEFRRYVRIPIITEISIVSADGRRFTATSQEISTGGMSVKSPEDVSPVRGLRFHLLC